MQLHFKPLELKVIDGSETLEKYAMLIYKLSTVSTIVNTVEPKLSHVTSVQIHCPS